MLELRAQPWLALFLQLSPFLLQAVLWLLGVHVVFAGQCHRLSKISVANYQSVSQQLLTLQSYVWILMSRKCVSGNDREDASTHAFREGAYSQFILAKYGCLGKGNRCVCPSCVVLKILTQYPSVTGVYMGFWEHWNYVLRLHSGYMSIYWTVLITYESETSCWPWILVLCYSYM